MKSKAIFMALLGLAFGGAEAVPVSRFQATAAAQAWVKGGRRLGIRVGQQVEATADVTASDGSRLYAVRMRDGGTVLMSGDTDFEPVVGFTSEAVDLSSIDEGSPLRALIDADRAFRRRVAELKAAKAGGKSARALSHATAAAPGPDTSTAAGRRWAALLPAAAGGGDLDTAEPIPRDANVLDDQRVDIMLKTKWGQSSQYIQGGGSAMCFNLYTPEHSVCGCVATAFAQTMRYHCWPVDEVAPFSKTCTYDGQKIRLTTEGGAFDWANMTEFHLSANASEREAQCQAIGRLTYECGVAVEMGYTKGSSGAYTADVPGALKSLFGYTNAVWCSESLRLTNEEAFRENIIYPSLDAGYPVIFSIRGGMGGHAVVCDGYGYNDVDGEATPYVHINMGWNSQNDWWYNLPNIDVDDNPEGFYGFEILSGVGYDIFPTNTGHIVSGRVLDFEGIPVAGATVTVDGQEVLTSSHGVFAFIVNKAAGDIDFFASSADGRYQGELSVSYAGGDLWGNDITISTPAVEVNGEYFATLDRALAYAADFDNPTVRILQDVDLRRSATITNSLTIVATNPVAAASAVLPVARALLRVADGAEVSFTNVVFQHGDGLTVDVQTGGVVKVFSGVDLGTVRLATVDNFRLAGPLTAAITIDAPFAKTSGEVFGRFQPYSAEAAATANYLLDAYDDESGGESYFNAGQDRYELRWKSSAEVPAVAAAVRIKDGGAFVNYRSFGALFRHYPAGGEIAVVKNVSLTNCLAAIDTPLFLYGETPGLEVWPDVTARFVVNEGGSLVISNLTVSGYVGPRLFSVRGGEMRLERDAELRDLVRDGSPSLGDDQDTWAEPGGVTALEWGLFTMLPGSRIVDCAAVGDGTVGSWGGGIYAYGGTLDLRGGEIVGCSAFMGGGGVYAEARYGDLDVLLSGDLRVQGNTRNPDGSTVVVDNLAIAGADLYDPGVMHLAQVVAPLDSTAVIGISYDGDGAGNAPGDSFADVSDALDQSAQTLAVGAFRNDVYPKVRAEVVGSAGATQLAWMQMDEEDGQVSPDLAEALVIYGDGTEAPVTNYYAYVEKAFECMTNDATVVVLADEDLTYDVSVAYNALLVSPAGAPVVLSRSADYDVGFTVCADASLTVSNLTFDGKYNPYLVTDAQLFVSPLFSVEGGALTLGGGATIRRSGGKDAYSAAAVLITRQGVFTMEEGSLIENCVNTYEGETEGVLKDSEAGLAGGVIVNGGVANFRGGEIRNCEANKGGAVFVCNDSIARVSGSFRVTVGNGREKDWCVADITHDGDGLICLDGVYDGAAGVNRGWSPKEGFITTCSNVFGIVEYDGDLSDLAASAAKFRSNLDDNAYGMIATNDANSLLVWSTAVVGDVFVDDDGNEYHVVAGGEPPEPPGPGPEPPGPGPEPPEPGPTIITNTPGPLAFQEIVRVSNLEWRLVVTNRTAKCEYALAYTDDLASGFTTTGGWERAEADGVWTTNVIFTIEQAKPAFFWKALGRETYDPVDP